MSGLRALCAVALNGIASLQHCIAFEDAHCLICRIDGPMNEGQPHNAMSNAFSDWLQVRGQPILKHGLRIDSIHAAGLVLWRLLQVYPSCT